MNDDEPWVQARLDAAGVPDGWDDGRAERMRRAAARAREEFAHTPVDGTTAAEPMEEPAPRGRRVWPLALGLMLAAGAVWYVRPPTVVPSQPSTEVVTRVEPPAEAPAAPPAPKVAVPPPTPTATPEPAVPATPKVVPEATPVPAPKRTTEPTAPAQLAMRQDWPLPARSDLRRSVTKGLSTSALGLTVSPSGARTVGTDVGFTVSSDQERSLALCVLGPESGVIWHGDLSPGSTILRQGSSKQRFRFTIAGEYLFVLATDAQCGERLRTRRVNVVP